MTDKKIEEMNVDDVYRVCVELANHIHSQCVVKCRELCSGCHENICGSICLRTSLRTSLAYCTHYERMMLILKFLNLMGYLKKERDCNTLGGDEQIG